jgi:2-polyprenyl-3-methyl-5-hydroxy-6-metoxy-1,4-benzoquinol methylase
MALKCFKLCLNSPMDVRAWVRGRVVSFFAKLPPKARVYDIGCGDKPFSGPLDALGCSYIGVDVERGFYGMESIDLVGSAYDVPAVDADADAVLLVQVIEHLQRPRDAFLEGARLLKVGV